MLKKQNYSSSSKKHIYDLELKGDITHEDLIDSYSSMIKGMLKRSRVKQIPQIKRINNKTILVEFDKNKKVPNYISTNKVNYLRKSLKDMYLDLTIEMVPIEQFIESRTPEEKLTTIDHNVL